MRAERCLQTNGGEIFPPHPIWTYHYTVGIHSRSTLVSTLCMSYYCPPHLCIRVRQDILAGTGQASTPFFQSLYINNRHFLGYLRHTPPCASIDSSLIHQDMSGSLVPRNHRYKYHIWRQSPNHRIHKDPQTKQ